MDQAFADIGGANATELLPVFPSTFNVRSYQRTPMQLVFQELPTITSRQTDRIHAFGDIKAIINKQNLEEQYVTIFDTTVDQIKTEVQPELCRRRSNMGGGKLFRHPEKNEGPTLK